MFKKLLLAFVAFTGMAMGQVTTPTIQGTYDWTGSDSFIFGNLTLTGSIPQCPSGEVMNGYTSNFTPNCVSGGGAAAFNWTGNLGASQGSSDTTITLSATVSGLTAPGTFLVDGEYETFTGISGAVLTGITRGVSLTTPTAHSNGVNITSVSLAFSPFTQVPWGGVFGGNGASELVANCGTPAQFVTGGSATSFQANCGNSALRIFGTGAIFQFNQPSNIFGPIYIGPQYANGNLTAPNSLPLVNTTYVAQTNGQYQFAQPLGLSGTYGPLTTQPVPTITVPTYSGETGGSCSATYDLTGLDIDGNVIPGTPFTLTGLLPWIYGVQGLVGIQAPQVAGVATWKLYRTALSGSCGVVTTTGLIATTTAPYPYMQDTAIVGDNTTAPISNTTIAKQCVGSAGNSELYCHLSGAGSSPPVGCSSATYGWDYTNTSATSGGNLHCYSGQTTWKATDNPAGILSVNGDTTQAQNIACSGSCSANTVAGTTTITVTGSAGTGAVAPGNYGQMGGYVATGGVTTTSPVPNFYALNPAWNLTQMNALFSRFNGAVITAWSITSNVVTFTAANSYSVGDGIFISGLTTGSYINGYTLTVSAATATSFVASGGGFTHANASATEAGVASIQGVAGVVDIPPGLIDSPATAYSNTVAQVNDQRKGYAQTLISKYGIKCDAKVLTLTVTSGSNQVYVGSDFSTSPVGETLAMGQQVGYGFYGLQEDWEPLITAFNSGTGYITLGANAPFGMTGTMIAGTDNHSALTTAFADLGQVFPLTLPTGCAVYTSAVRWNGTNFLGQQSQSGGFIGAPAQDIFQQQDGTPITAWSINTGTGLTTFTIPAYAAHNILVGDLVALQNFGTSTFFNGINVSIYSIPTPTTFTVASVFSRSTSSSTEAGLAGITAAANTNALRIEHVGFSVNNAIDPSFAWNHYSPSATLTVEPPMARGTDMHSEPANNPLAPGWGLGAVNGIANITQNSAVICVSTTVVGGATPRIPVTGTTILFPYQGDGLYKGTVSSYAGSCSGAFTPVTLSAALPNNAAFTATQAEWFTYTTAQTLSVAIPATITYPHTITVNLPIAPIPVYESNVSSHGRLIIGTDEFDYMGTLLTTTNGTSQLILRDGPTSINGGAGDAIGAAVFPLNPCAALYNNPWPVLPTLNSVGATPAYATYYAGICAGNAALAFPNADAHAYTGVSSGMSVAFVNDIIVSPTQKNALGNANNNGSMFLFEQGNNTGYGNTIDNVRDNYTWGGIIQAPASVNQYGVGAVGPTSTGQSIANCTFRTGYPIVLMGFEQGNIDRCDTYETETSPYDGTSVGATTGLYLGRSLSETTGGIVTNVYQTTIKDYNGENETGNGEEIPPSVISDCDNCTWIGDIFEGGFNIFGGAFQTFHGTQMSGPMFNYGTNNYFDKLYGPTIGYNDSNIYDGSNSFWNWGAFSTCQASIGNSGGPLQGCGPGYVQSYNGHDIWASMMGNNLHPNENILGGMILPEELNTAMGLPVVFDSTEPWSGKHTECAIGSGLECVGNGSYDGFSGYVYIGPHKRITDTQMVLKTLLKLKNSGTATVRIFLTAQNGGSYSTCTPNYSGIGVGTATVTSTGWTPVQVPVDFTGYASCTMGLQFDNGSASNTLEIGYLNFIPFTGQLYVPLGTHNVGDACPVAGEISLDSAHFWTCSPTSGVTFGAGTWQEH